MEDWRKKNECYPFEDSDGNLCISVKSEYESFGGEQEARLNEAKYYGIDRLIRFYGKLTPPTELYDAASTPDYFISSRVCARMKVLVKIPKSTFDENTADDTTCNINKPPEGYLSAFISVENYERDIDYITTSMEDFLPKMAKADKYMTNINIVKEIKRLKKVKNVIRRHFNLNSVTPTAIKEEECEPDVESLMEIGFSYDYKPVFVLIDGNKHTIGYDCFLEASLLNHPTTANYLIQLGNMSHALTKQLSLDFDIFQFLTQHTYPTPVIEAKENTLDGLDKYDANGNLFSFANLAKLITLDLDKKSCKPDENVSNENRIIINKETRNEAARAAAQTKQFIGDWRLSTEGAGELKETLGSMWETVSDRHEAEKALKKVMNDVLEKVNWGCVLEESLQCMLEESITKFGTSVFEDPDLGQFFSADGAVELLGLCQPDDGCENELQLRVGIPSFQGITIPANFPTTDYLAKTMDLALKQLYNVLINSFVSLIMSLLDNACKMISSLPDGAAIGNMFADNFTSWLSETIGIDVSLLKDGQAWQDAALSAGGAGFMGVIGNLVSKTAGSMDSNGNWVWGGSATAVYSGTGVSLNLPNPNTGMVEEMFVSPEFISNIMSGVHKGTEDLEVVLTPGELYSMYKGSAPADVVELAFDCLNRGNPEIFQSQEDVTDVFSALGEMVNGSHLESPTVQTPVVTSMCDLGDGSSQDILRKNFLRSKDSSLSDSEIEELMSREKSRFIEKIKKMHKTLKSFQDGSIFPDFPSIFGSEDSLIPEPPLIIADAMKTVASGMYGSAINNLNATIFQYPDIWYTVFHNEINEIQVNLNDLYGDSQTAFSVNNEGDTIVMGYSLPAEVTTIPSEQYIDVLKGSTMENGWWFLHRGGPDGIDIGDYTSQATAGSEEPERTAFVEMISLLGFEKAYDYLDRRDILAKINRATETLGEMINNDKFVGEWARDFVDWFQVGLSFDKLNWDDLTIDGGFRTVKRKLKESIDFVMDTMGVSSLDEWRGFPEDCQKQLFKESYSRMVADGVEWGSGGTYGFSDNDFINFTDVVNIYDEVDDYYAEAVSSLVVMDIADFLEDWDDSGDGNFSDADGWIDWNDKFRVAEISPAPELIDGSFDDDAKIGKVTLTYNITDVISLAKKEEFAAAQGISDVNDLLVTAFITFKKEFVGKNSFYVKASLQYDTAGEDIEIDAVRDDYWTATLTTLERRGVRLIAATDTSSEEDGSGATVYEQYQHGAGSLVNIYSAIASGGNSEYDVVANNQIKTNIGNYRIANDLMISLGRKESKSNLLEEKYSFNTDNASYGLLDWFNSAGTGSSMGATAGQYTKLVIDSGGTQADSTYTLDYMFKMQGILDDMRERVMTSQYRSTGSIGEMMDSYSTDDAIKYKDLTKWAEGNVIDVMKIQQLDEMCDALTPNRRTAASMGVRLLAREFILESVLISLQVFDTFSTGFMESEAFSQTIFDNMKTEMKKYDNSFDDTTKNSIFSDIKDAAVKYYEYRSLLGEEIEVSSGKSTLISIISEEINEIRKSIVNTLQLSETGTWDDFVFDEILPAAGFNIIEGYNEGEGYYFTDVETIYAEDMEQEEIVTLFSSQCGGTADEGSKEGGDTNVCGDIEDIILSGKYLTVRQQLFDNEEYKEFINHIFPLRELVTQLSVYQSSALSDVAVFSGTLEGRNLFDIFAETKLSTLQVLLASVHGAGETTYIDPFLEKLKT